MPNQATSTLLTPVQPGERIEVMDVLRGFALFGILLMNIEGFVGPLMASTTGTDPNLQGANRAVDWLIYVLVQGKFMPLFSLLFGMGFALMMDRARQRGQDGAGVYVRRLLALLGIGIVHAVLIWAGDVLVSYALLGFVMLLLFRDTPASRLPIWAIACATVMVGLILLLGLMMQFAGSVPEGEAMLDAQARQAAATILAERRAYGSGGYVDATLQRVHDTVEMLGALPIFGLLVLTMFLLGAWLVRAGIMRDTAAHASLFRKLLIVGLLVGLPMMLVSAILHPTMDYARFGLGAAWWMSVAMVAGILMSLGYASAIVLAMQRPAWRAWLSWLAPAGRMALTNYLAQSLVCTLLFYGYGLGFFERLPRVWQPLFVVVLFAAQVVLSRWWLSRFRHGPVEWLWRWLTYGRRPEFRLAPAAA